jgi:hypothetical protein
MTAALRLLLLVTVVAIFAQLTAAQESKEVTIKEPGIYELEDLFKRADTVALVKIVAGDTEAYNVAIYKAEIIKSFKGGASGGTIFFGPYLGERLGWEHILFLRNVSKPITPKSTSRAGFGTVHYSEIFNEGYTSMEISYECVFDGTDIAQKCDYGVRICTDYIRLPKSIPSFPPSTKDTSFGCRWAKKASFISLLDALGQRK